MDDDSKDEDGGKETGEVGQVSAVEGLLEGTELHDKREDEMK